MKEDYYENNKKMLKSFNKKTQAMRMDRRTLAWTTENSAGQLERRVKRKEGNTNWRQQKVSEGGRDWQD
jgi:3-phenylpropionate/cinnamic acid dioxygenase small subunit